VSFLSLLIEILVAAVFHSILTGMLTMSFYILSCSHIQPFIALLVLYLLETGVIDLASFSLTFHCLLF